MKRSVISANTAGSHSSAYSCLFARSHTTAVTSQTRAPASLNESLRLARARGFSTTGGGATGCGAATGTGAGPEGTTEIGASRGVGPAEIFGGRDRRSSRYQANPTNVIAPRKPRSAAAIAGSG